MLTTTYSLVAISTEQKNVLSLLSRLQHTIRQCWENLKEFDLPQLEAALNQLTQFDRYCQARKVELYVIPAVRGVAEEVDVLLAELESMTACGVAILRSVKEQLRHAIEEGADKLNELCKTMEVYCEHLFKRLAKEENELLPMVGRILTPEEWFPIAAKFLLDDAHKNKSSLMHVV